jgi:hypothetical protein
VGLNASWQQQPKLSAATSTVRAYAGSLCSIRSRSSNRLAYVRRMFDEFAGEPHCESAAYNAVASASKCELSAKAIATWSLKTFHFTSAPSGFKAIASNADCGGGLTERVVAATHCDLTASECTRGRKSGIAL